MSVKIRLSFFHWQGFGFMNILKKIVLICDRINEWIGHFIVSFAVLFFISIIFGDVILRYFFNTSFVFLAELEWHVFAFIILIGAGYTLLHDGHVRVDILYSMMSKKSRARVDFIGVLIFLIPSCYVVLKTTIPWVMVSYEIGEMSIDPGGIPSRFLIKSVLPIGYLLILIQGISLCIRNLFILLDDPIETVDS